MLSVHIIASLDYIPGLQHPHLSFENQICSRHSQRSTGKHNLLSCILISAHMNVLSGSLETSPSTTISMEPILKEQAWVPAPILLIHYNWSRHHDSKLSGLMMVTVVLLSHIENHHSISSLRPAIALFTLCTLHLFISVLMDNLAISASLFPVSRPAPVPKRMRGRLSEFYTLKWHFRPMPSMHTLFE